MLGVGNYFWRLLPGNPILLRVVQTAGKRKRDLLIRCAYLGLLVFFSVASLFTTQGITASQSLTDLSNASRTIFRQMSYLQLGLVALLAPIFTAGAITQEKDSQTYDILLSTPLSNAQIVLGSLMSRLFFVIALLVSGIPIFSVTQIFGGVAIHSIVMSFAIAAATACVTGALAMAIATFKVGTRRTIFSFYLFIVIYLLGIWLLDKLPYFHVAGPKTAGGQASHISWFTGVHPFLALRVVLGDPSYQPPDPGLLPAGTNVWPINWYLTSPASFYIGFTCMLSAVLVVPSIVMLRRLAQSSTTVRTWLLSRLRIISSDRTRKPRTVWQNPIAWREARTRASAARASALRWGFIAAGVIGAIVLLVMYASTPGMPGKYITPNSLDAGSGTLFIHGDTTYGVRPDVQVTLIDERQGNRTGGMELLAGHFEVRSFTTRMTPRRTRQI
ncbi:MAG TPA: ABC transporter permease, partial [Tepidisphaeraceae bacterium]|nr:ABC transporter permease [Tepidisphaeraceae bacterium]